jgi:hypothetical protein
LEELVVHVRVKARHHTLIDLYGLDVQDGFQAEVARVSGLLLGPEVAMSIINTPYVLGQMDIFGQDVFVQPIVLEYKASKKTD